MHYQKQILNFAVANRVTLVSLSNNKKKRFTGMTTQEKEELRRTLEEIRSFFQKDEREIEEILSNNREQANEFSENFRESIQMKQDVLGTPFTI